MEPYPHQPTTPYAIGSADWVLPVSPRSSPVNPKNVHGVSRESFYTVLEVFTKVYCVAKIAYVALTNYEVEVG